MLCFKLAIISVPREVFLGNFITDHGDSIKLPRNAFLVVGKMSRRIVASGEESHSKRGKDRSNVHYRSNVDSPILNEPRKNSPNKIFSVRVREERLQFLIRQQLVPKIERRYSNRSWFRLNKSNHSFRFVSN